MDKSIHKKDVIISEKEVQMDIARDRSKCADFIWAIDRYGSAGGMLIAEE